MDQVKVVISLREMNYLSRSERTTFFRQTDPLPAFSTACFSSPGDMFTFVIRFRRAYRSFVASSGTRECHRHQKLPSRTSKCVGLFQVSPLPRIQSTVPRRI